MDVFRPIVTVLFLTLSVVGTNLAYGAEAFEEIGVTTDGTILVSPDTVSLESCGPNSDGTLPNNTGAMDAVSGAAVIKTFGSNNQALIRGSCPPGGEFESLGGARIVKTGKQSCNTTIFNSSMVDDVCYTAIDDQGTGGNERKLDLTGLNTSGQTKPLVIMIHGGGWKQGSRKQAALDVATDSLVANGYAVARITYRIIGNSPDNEVLAEHLVLDVQRAVNFLIDHQQDLYINPDYVFLMGFSAGSHLASLVGTRMPDKIKGVVAYKGIFDLRGPWDVGTATWNCATGVCSHQLTANPSPDPTLEPILGTGYNLFTTQPLPDGEDIRDMAARFLKDEDGNVYHLDGSDFDYTNESGRSTAQELAHRMSPVEHYAFDTPPHIYVHGLEDTLVNYRQSVRAHTALLAAKNNTTQAIEDNRLVLVAGEDHGIFPETPLANTHWDDVLDFLNDHTYQQSPSVTAQWNPDEIAMGEDTVLTWSSTNATGCVDPWGSTVATSGQTSPMQPTATNTYTMSCTGMGGTGSADATITVHPLPTLTAYWQPATINLGEQTTLYWSSENTDSCLGHANNPIALSGDTGLISPTQTEDYVLKCDGPGGHVEATATLTVIQPPPTLTAAWNPSAIAAGELSTLSWSSTNATSCIGNAGNPIATTGSVGPIAVGSSGNYVLECTGPGGTVQATAPITVHPQPTLTASWSPSVITQGQTSVLSWSSTNATSCIGNAGNPIATTGSVGPLAVSSSGVYTLQCTGPGGTVQATAGITVLPPPPPPPSMYAYWTPNNIAPGQTSSLVWGSFNTTQCWGAAGNPIATSGSVGPLVRHTGGTWVLSCVGPGGSTSAAAVLVVQ